MLPVSEYALRNVQQPRQDNIAGVEAVWYTLASNLLNFPYSGPLAIGQLQLREGTTWYQMVSVRRTVRYKGTQKDLGRHGDAHNQKLVGTLARHTPGLARGLEALEGQELVALYRDLNGQVQLLGTPEQPLSWQDTYDSGQEPGNSRNNYDWVLQGDCDRRARPYLGSWQVSALGLDDSLTLQPPPGGGSGGDGSVELRTAGGRLLAVVPAGRSIVLKSGFKLGWEIV